MSIAPKSNPIQFAVVREDPEIEAAVLTPGSQRVMLIASGGCTALTLGARYPETTFTLVDPNPAQIDLIHRKIAAIKAGRQDDTLVTCGNFESLFGGLREFIYEFVLPRKDWLDFFSEPKPLDEVFLSKYWPVAFQLYFSDALLVAMFGPDAIQYAPKGSYPEYFQKVLERGLRREDVKSNYFLHHILLGHYLPDFRPGYLSHRYREEKFEFVQAFAQDVANFGRFDMISLSNIFDWMAPEKVAALAKRISQEAKPGTSIVFRQLNNTSNFEKHFSGFQFDEGFAKSLHALDRSLFYSSLHIGRKV